MEICQKRDFRIGLRRHAPVGFGRLCGRRIKWWQTTAVYQIYPKSFADTTGNGVGDIPGIIRHLDHIRSLGAGAIWLTPVYSSPMVDNGYDISDYTDIDPAYGT